MFFSQHSIVVHVHYKHLIVTIYLWRNGLVVRALDSQFKGTRFKTTGWLKGQLSLSSFLGRSNEYQELLWT